jgi:hypothetical protein
MESTPNKWHLSLMKWTYKEVANEDADDDDTQREENIAEVVEIHLILRRLPSSVLFEKNGRIFHFATNQDPCFDQRMSWTAEHRLRKQL